MELWRVPSALMRIAIMSMSMAFGNLVKVAQWQISNGRWWYSHADGSYTTNNWELIGGQWYYFDASGYMLSSSWIGNYYVKADGTMTRSEWVDNGRVLCR